MNTSNPKARPVHFVHSPRETNFDYREPRETRSNLWISTSNTRFLSLASFAHNRWQTIEGYRVEAIYSVNRFFPQLFSTRPPSFLPSNLPSDSFPESGNREGVIGTIPRGKRGRGGEFWNGGNDEGFERNSDRIENGWHAVNGER